MLHGGGGFGYGTGFGAVGVQYPETQLQSVIRKLKHCTSIHYLDNVHGGQGLYGSSFGMDPGLALGGGLGGFGYGGLEHNHLAFGSGVFPSHVGGPLAPGGLHQGQLGYGPGLLHHGLGYGGGLLTHGHLPYGSGGLFGSGDLSHGLGYGGAAHHAGFGYGGALSHGGLGYGSSLSHSGFGYGSGLLSHNGLSYGSSVLGSHHPLHGSPFSSSLSGYHYGTGGGFPLSGGFQHSFRR
ncbi:unnamed protein product [Ixodes hexagonus]